MRNAALFLLTLLVAFAAASPNIFSPFYEPIIQSFFGTGNNTASSNELRRRQSDACPTGYGNNCADLGAAGLCCPDDSICSADAAGHVACCPSGAACTGSITSTDATTAVATAAATNTDSTGVGGVILGSGTSSTTLSSSESTTSFIFASAASPSSSSAPTASAGGVIVTPASGSQTTIATVPNPYFPIAILPATYPDAGACSDAYSSCQSDVAQCNTLLQGGSASSGGGNGGITINAPNGGTTVAASVTTTLPSSQASSVCSSLSVRACGTFSVEQCSIFGTASASATGSTGGAGVDRSAHVQAVYVVVIALVMVAT